jgi:hypothetical protein
MATLRPPPGLGALSQHWRLAGFRSWPPRSTGFLVAFALAPLVLAFLSTLAPVHPEFLFSDPAGMTGLPPYAGLFSFAGILAWWSAATACVLVASVAPRSRHSAMLACAGMLSAMLALDDLFMIHERVAPWFGVPENLVMGGYAVAGAAYLYGFRDLHRRLDWPLLLAALGLLGFSVGFDVVSGYSVPGLVIEEGTKFAGVVAWSAYHLLAARICLRRALEAGTAPRA